MKNLNKDYNYISYFKALEGLDGLKIADGVDFKLRNVEDGKVKTIWREGRTNAVRRESKRTTIHRDGVTVLLIIFTLL